MNFRLGINRFGGSGGSNAITNINPPYINGTARVGETLWVYPGDYTNDPGTYAFQWQRGGANISGATGTNYTLVTGDADALITCNVTPTGGTLVSSAAVGPVHAASFAALTLLRTSTSGASPFTWDVTNPGSVYATDIWRLQIASDQAFTAITYDATKGISENEFATPFNADWTATADPAPSTPFPTISGTVFIRMRAETEDGLVVGVYSNVESNATIVTAASVQTPVSAHTTLSNGNLTLTGDANDYWGGRANAGKTSGKRSWQLTWDSGAGGLAIGVDNGGTDLLTLPVWRSNGAGIYINASSWSSYLNATNVTSAGGTFGAGDRFRVEFDDAAHTLALYRITSGAVQTLLTTVTGIATMGTYYATVGAFNSVQTAKFGTGQAGTLTSGFIEYDS